MRAVFYWCIAGIGVLYAPLGFMYAWHLFVPGAPALHDSVTIAIGGRNYAVGPYSVVSVRARDYADHRVLMLIHTSLGAVALTLALLQLSRRLRTRRPDIHRWCGRVYFMLMTASMSAAIAFLLLRPPANYVGSTAFDVQLWTLAVATLVTGAVALRAIRRRDVLTHQAWIGMHVALMMTAPMLRALWTLLAPLRPEYNLLTNLGAGSIMLGVAMDDGWCGIDSAVRGSHRVDSDVHYGQLDGFVAGAMVGPGLPIIVAFALTVQRAVQESSAGKQVRVASAKLSN